jgi:hypothetical protein
MPGGAPQKAFETSSEADHVDLIFVSIVIFLTIIQTPKKA